MNEYSTLSASNDEVPNGMMQWNTVSQPQDNGASGRVDWIASIAEICWLKLRTPLDTKEDAMAFLLIYARFSVQW